MGYMNEFPHSRMFDSDLREILEMYNTVKGLPSDWNTFRETMTADWTELKNFVNTFFRELNVQNEINNKIDALVADGTMDALIRPIFESYNTELNLLKVRVDNLAKLEEGSTTGDAELVDGHIDKDGNTHVNIGEHIREVSRQLSSDIGELNSYLAYELSLDYTKFIVSGKKNDGNGQVYVDPSYNMIYYLPVHGFSKLDLREIALIKDFVGVAGYGKNKEFIRQIDSNEKTWYKQNEICVLNDDIFYVSFSYYVPESAPVVIGSGIKYCVYNNQERINGLESYLNYVNMLGLCKHETDCYYGIIGKQEQYGYESFIFECNENNNIRISTNANSVAQCAAYYEGEPSENSFISYENYNYPSDYGTAHITDLVLNIPSGAKYVVINNKLNDGESTKIEIKTLGFNGKVYENKNFLVLGDSITALSDSWTKYFREEINPNIFDNVAVIGAHWCDYNNHTVYNGNPLAVGDEQNVIGNQVQKIINNRSSYLDDYDYIFIAGGTNDETSSGELSISEVNSQYFNSEGVLPLEDVDRSTWSGATRWVVSNLRTLFPNATIVFNTPINRMDFRLSDRVYNNANMVRECSKITSTYLCDTEHCGIPMDDSSYFGDLLHLSDKGAKKLGHFVANWYIHNYNELN